MSATQAEFYAGRVGFMAPDAHEGYGFGVIGHSVLFLACWRARLTHSFILFLLHLPRLLQELPHFAEAQVPQPELL